MFSCLSTLLLDLEKSLLLVNLRYQANGEEGEWEAFVMWFMKHEKLIHGRIRQTVFLHEKVLLILPPPHPHPNRFSSLIPTLWIFLLIENEVEEEKNFSKEFLHKDETHKNFPPPAAPLQFHDSFRTMTHGKWLIKLPSIGQGSSVFNAFSFFYFIF